MTGIHIKPSHKDLLHRAMNVSPGQTLSLADVAKTKTRAKHTGNVKLEKQATFAENAKRWSHDG